MTQAGIHFEKIHDLVALLDQVLAVEPGWTLFRTDFGVLTRYAVKVRYPGPMASRPEALEARRVCRQFRVAARVALGLKT